MSVQVIQWTERKAAHGKHRCVYCGEHIAAREQYGDMRCACDGTAWTQRSHLACTDLVNRYAVDVGLDDEDWPDWQEVLSWAAAEVVA